MESQIKLVHRQREYTYWVVAESGKMGILQVLGLKLDLGRRWWCFFALLRVALGVGGGFLLFVGRGKKGGRASEK